MITKITAGLLAVTLFASCTTTTTTTKRTTLRETTSARLVSAETTSTNATEPPAPAEGPEDIPAEGPKDPVRNPALVPTPLLRINAAGGL